MAKVLRIAAMVVAVAAAIPSGGTSLLGAGLSVGASTASLIATAVSFAASAVTALTAKKPSIQGGQTEWQSDPNGPIPIVFGDTQVSGAVIYRKTTSKLGGTKNKFQFLCSVMSLGPIEAIDDTVIDKASTSFAGDAAIGSLAGRIYQRTQLGATPEASALIPIGPWPSIPHWGASNKLSGYAASMNCYVFDGKGDNTFTQVPVTQWRLRGVKCYDPRLDSTYPGGSGGCRADDETTWVFSQNAWIQAITFALGWHHGPNQIRVGGVGQPVSSIDLAAYVEAANVADANGWKSGGRVLSSDNKWDTLKSICQAGGGEPVRLGATLSCMVNAPRVSIGTITRSDVTGNVSVTTTQTRRDRVNGIIPKYRSEDHGFEQVPAGVVRNTDYLAEDGGIERTKEVTYSLVQCYAGDTPDQVAQIAGYDIANAREAGPGVFPLMPRWTGYKAGDCLTIEDTPEFGYLAGKDVIVLTRQIDAKTGGVVLTLREETPAKHTWALGLVGTPAPLSDGNPVPEAEAPDAGDWDATTSVTSSEFGVIGSIDLTGGVTDDTAMVVLFEYRETGATDWIVSGWGTAGTTSYAITGLDVTKTWDVAVSYHGTQRLEFTGLTFDTSGIEIVYDGGAA